MYFLVDLPVIHEQSLIVYSKSVICKSVGVVNFFCYLSLPLCRILGAFTKLWTATICPSICPPTWNSSASTARIYMKVNVLSIFPQQLWLSRQPVCYFVHTLPVLCNCNYGRQRVSGLFLWRPGFSLMILHVGFGGQNGTGTDSLCSSVLLSATIIPPVFYTHWLIHLSLMLYELSFCHSLNTRHNCGSQG
jgi:hypothetical protein